MEILQALTDGAISANWFYGSVLVVVSFLLRNYIKKLDTMIDNHEKDIQTLKTGHEIQDVRLSVLENQVDHIQDKNE